MKTIELIKLRTGGSISHEQLKPLYQIAADANRSLKTGEVKFYKHGLVEGDFAYLLIWEEDVIDPQGSTPGLRIRKSLESMGIVDYSTWKLID